MGYAVPLAVGSTTTHYRTDQSRDVLAKYPLIDSSSVTYKTHDVSDSALNMETLNALYPDKISLRSELREENEGPISLHDFPDFIQPTKEYTVNLGW